MKKPLPSHPVDRRTFLSGAGAAALLAASASAASAPSKIIDTHAHFYDPSRSQGVLWPPKTDTILYRPVLPAEFRRLTGPLGVTGVIEVEASPLLEDNQWVLDLAEKNPIIIGTVGDLQPERKDFPAQLARFHRNPRFKGIRCGNLWDRNLSTQISDPRFIAGLKLLAQADLEMDSANPNPALLAALLRLTDRVPDLRIVIDHLPIRPPTSASARAAFDQTMRHLADRPQVFIKVSSVLRRVNGRVPENLNVYRPALDELWQLFGSDRLIYGSNWPVSNLIAPYPAVLQVVREYFAGKGSEATEKYFWRNATKAYRLS